jgi:hypothetical protein
MPEQRSEYNGGERSEPRAEQTQPISKAKAAGSKRLLCPATIEFSSPTLRRHRFSERVSESHDRTDPLAAHQGGTKRESAGGRCVAASVSTFPVATKRDIAVMITLSVSRRCPPPISTVRECSGHHDPAKWQRGQERAAGGMTGRGHLPDSPAALGDRSAGSEACQVAPHPVARERGVAVSHDASCGFVAFPPATKREFSVSQ